MKKLFLLVALVVTCSIATYILLPPQIPISPLGANIDLDNNPTGKKDYVILGFAPYWNMKKLSAESLDTITHFAYFAIHLRGNGEIYTKVNAREEDPGYTNYKRLLSAPPYNNLILTFMQEDEDALVNMIASPTSRQTAVKNIVNTVKEANAVGVNIDLEPVGATTATIRDNFTLFIKELHIQLDQMDKLLSVSIYASAAARPRLWDLPKLESYVDYFVVMTYDYTMPKSERAGPNSPLRDFSGEFEHSIIKNLGELASSVPSSKLLLGIPLWDTVDDSKYAPTESRGVTASLERIESMLQDRTLELIWDRNSLTPYGVSTESGSPTQIYFENETSIRLKLELVKSSGLGGIALWALGYDNNVSWLWPTLKTLR
ncbi:glycoside hydrolase family 18 protein [Candidatus Woesebacteria bacterium]|nr:glycoside hydrolase family 18 protein [Candidatus Woesebacteria bacterium]